MADSFGNLSAPRHPAPVRPTGDGRPAPAHPPTHPATVLAVTGSEEGVVHHQVRLLGRVVPLDAPAEIPVGTVLEVLAQRGPDGLRAVLPELFTGVPNAEGIPAPAPGGPRPSTSPELPAAVLPTSGSPVPGASFRAGGIPEDLPVEVVARLRSEGLENATGVRAARRLVGLGIEPHGALLRGAAHVEAHPAPTIANLGADLVASLEPLVAAREPIVAHAPSLGEIPALARLIRDAILTAQPPSLHDLEAGLSRLVRTIVQGIESALASDPRVAAARTAMAELLANPSPTAPAAGSAGAGAPPFGGAGMPSGGEFSMTDVGDEPLSAGARRRGVELLRNLERRAIEEHPITREFGRLLREVLDRSDTLGARVAIERAERDAGFRADPDSTWFVATEEGRPVRVRRSIRRDPHDEGDDSAERRFRIETRGWGLGEVVVDGTQRDRGREVVVGLEISAARPSTRRALAAEVGELVESFDGTALTVTAAVVPWRSEEGASGGAEAPREVARNRPDGLDRRV